MEKKLRASSKINLSKQMKIVWLYIKHLFLFSHGLPWRVKKLRIILSRIFYFQFLFKYFSSLWFFLMWFTAFWLIKNISKLFTHMVKSFSHWNFYDFFTSFYVSVTLLLFLIFFIILLREQYEFRQLKKAQKFVNIFLMFKKYLF